MKYSPSDIALLKSDLEDENVPDKGSEIRPWVPKGKTHVADGSDDKEDIDDYREDILSDWNLRKYKKWRHDTCK